jgi:adenosylhomocysteine nucleosidase
VSEILQALYEGRSADVDAFLAADPAPVLDVFEAAALGRVDRLRELVTADPSLAQAFADDGFTALHLATFLGPPEAAAVLLEAGAEVEAPSRNPMGVRPVNSAAAGRHPVEHLRQLLAHGADPNGAQASGHTALDEARHRDDAAMIALLEAAGGRPGGAAT